LDGQEIPFATASHDRREIALRIQSAHALGIGKIN
jgi:hypothetical protein